MIGDDIFCEAVKVCIDHNYKQVVRSGVNNSIIVSESVFVFCEVR
jgi:hypothetical protein